MSCKLISIFCSGVAIAASVNTVAADTLRTNVETKIGESDLQKLDYTLPKINITFAQKGADPNAVQSSDMVIFYARDGSAMVVGTYQKAEDGFYRINTSLGDFSLFIDHWMCVGNACPAKAQIELQLMLQAFLPMHPNQTQNITEVAK